jgi:DNA-binding CsgD family transcriptional regulator
LILVLVGAVALIMSGFLIMNVVNGLLLSQKKIIGIMKIVGADRWQIFGVYLVMMASLGVLALLIALPVSILLGTAIAGFISGVINFDVIQSGFTPLIAALEVGVAVLVPLAFSAGPIWSALRVTPAEAISEVTPRQTTSLLERILAKLENLPRILMLAFRSLFRNNVRLVVTMLTHIVNTPARSAASTLTDQLSERELEILKLMTHGLHYDEIARRVFLSEGTVRNYASAIFTKLGVSDRIQAVVLAIRFGLVSARDI